MQLLTGRDRFANLVIGDEIVVSSFAEHRAERIKIFLGQLKSALVDAVICLVERREGNALVVELCSRRFIGCR